MSMPPTSQIAALISSIVALIQQGQWAMAERQLTQLVGQMPAEPDALQLMGLVRASQGRHDEAEKLYRRSLALRPKQPNVQVNLGKLLVETGRAEEGIALLRATARANPNYLDAVLVLGQVQHATGDLVFAERNLRAALKLQPDSISAMLSLGAVLKDLGELTQSEAMFRKALLLPAPPGLKALLEHNLGIVLKIQTRHGEALTHFDAAQAHNPELPLVDASRASALQHLGRHEEAIASFRRAIARDPLHLAAHQELNGLLYRLGRDGEFLKSYDEAAARAPNAAGLMLAKGGFLGRAERFEEARDCFARAAAAEPDSPAAQNGLGLAFAGLEQFDAAIAAYEKSLTLKPDDVVTQVNLAGTLLRMGETRRALTLTEGAILARPFDQGALAVHELALRASGDARAQILADYQRHVQVFDLEPPRGFADMASFNAALNAYLDTLHGDAREHIDQTLRRGTQTLDPLFDGDNPLIAALRQRIEESVNAYIQRMDDHGAHPLSSRRAAGFRFPGSWSSRLRDHGFHTNHIHPAGWISSCYYVEVPAAVEDEDARQGWIKFGEPSFALPAGGGIARSVKPVPGRLVLFPSYMWHGTMPFSDATARTTIAFDAIPA